MRIHLLVLMLLIASACQTGRIPCPTVKTVKMKRSTPNRAFSYPSSSLTVDAKDEKESTSKDLHTKGSKSSNAKTIKHISVEEWDCPRPGAKKYMPRAVKDNIRENMKKMNESANKQRADSVQINP